MPAMNEVLEEVRLEHGLTRQRISDVYGSSTSLIIFDIETGEIPVAPRHIKAYARATGLTALQICRRARH